MSDVGISGILEKVNNGADEGVMIGLLPITSDWSTLELPHLTLVYAGQVPDLPETAFNEMAKDAAMIAMLSRPVQLRVLRKEVFGGDGEDKVDVLCLQPSSELLSMRRALERWDASEHPFKPHATIGPQGTFLEMTPSYLAFDRICVGWGNEYLTFWLKR